MDRRFWACVAVCSLFLTAAIRGGSLWIDEGFSAWIACHRSFTAMLDSLRIGDASDLQMALYNVYLWAWVHIFGSSEYALRAANIPFIALLAASVGLAGRLALGRRYAWIAAVTSPFLWVYANEARAYFPMLACASASTAALLVYVYGAPEYRRHAAWLCSVFFLAAMLFHMLAGFLLPAFAAIFLAEGRTDWKRWWMDWRKPLAALAPLLGLTAAYFLWTLQRGENWVYGPPSLRHMLSVLYDFAGLGGLGPNRSALRHGAAWQTLRPDWFLLGSGSLALLVALAPPWTKRAKVIGAACLAGLLSAVLAGFAMNSLFLSRHVSALLPLLLFTLLASASRFRLALLAAVWLLSDARISLLSEYGKDDYRGAVAYLIEHNNGPSIAWAADPLAAAYYGLHTESPYHLTYFVFDYAKGLKRVDWPVQAIGVDVANWDECQVKHWLAAARQQKKPILLAFSKLDLYDVHRGWAPVLRGLTPVARYQSFDIYELNE